jgi:hypothetical protein
MDCNKEINVIKKYAQDSIDYGKKSGNETALKRGNAVLLSITRIGLYMDALEIEKRACDRAEDLNIKLMSQIVTMAKYVPKGVEL